MSRTAEQLRDDALAIWQAGLNAVRSERLIRDHVRVEGSTLQLGDEQLDLDGIGRIAVVGAGKAGTGMAVALQESLGQTVLEPKQVTGWVNVPGDCWRDLSPIHLHAARPAGVNEPTAEGVAGAERILELVGSLDSDDLCICLISGGGSALLPAPAEGIELADKLAITRHLSASGADIAELNAVRRRLSRIKGGGLARACRAGRLVALIISDVLGDPLEMIASGPTVGDSDPEQAKLAALEVVEKYDCREAGIREEVFDVLHREESDESKITSEVANIIIGNNAAAVDAAGLEAERRGYSHAMISATKPEGRAEDVGHHLAEMGVRMQKEPGPDCLISGGEPTVKLAPASIRGRGGRNQQLVLSTAPQLEPRPGLVILSGGTDGEDGPTDAAGAWLDSELLAEAREAGLDPADFLKRNDAYSFFAPLDGLIMTGPTHTNVCDLRVVLVDRIEQQE